MNFLSSIVLSITIIMGLLWAFQPLSLAITALIPIFLFPLVGIQAGVDVARTYSSNVSVIILRGFIMSLAMERWNLHKRIALNVMLKAGKNLGLIIAGFMFVASFLSMWASNTPMDQFDYYLEDDVINIYGGNFDLFQRIKDLIKSPIRLNYPPSYREFLQTYGALVITDFWICKKPIQQAFDKLLNVISFDNWQRKKDELNYDQMFHLFGIARLATNQYVLFEKNQVLNIGMVDKNIMKSCRSIYINPTHFQSSLKNIQLGRLDLNVMHQRCLEDIGPEKLFLYRGDSTNCQHFIYNMFNSSEQRHQRICNARHESTRISYAWNHSEIYEWINRHSKFL